MFPCHSNDRSYFVNLNSVSMMERTALRIGLGLALSYS